jgi:hypothetical protein
MLKIYGERNTGTNYVSQLLQINLNVPLLLGVAPEQCETEQAKDAYFAATYANNLGWKHGAAPDAHILADPRYDGIRFVTVSKNVYPWLLSFFRRPYHHPNAGKNFSQFIRSPVPLLGRDRIAGPFANPVLLWTTKYQSYFRLPQDRHIHIRYEAVLNDPRGFIEEVARRFAFEKSANFFTNVDSSTKGTKQQFSDYQRFYLDEQWKPRFSPDDRAFIRENLDIDLMKRLGYTPW